MDDPVMRVFVLAGGLGTRLRSVSGAVPKGLMPIGDQPFLRRLLERTAAQNLNECVLCLGYGAQAIMDYFDAKPVNGMRILYSVESEPRGTAGALRVAQTYWDAHNLVMNGDTELTCDFHALYAFHRLREADVTIGLARMEDASRYGRVELADDGRVLAFREKDGVKQSGVVNAGVYVAPRSALSAIPAEGHVSIERDWLPALLQARRRVYGMVVADGFTDIGTPEDYWRLANYG